MTPLALAFLHSNLPMAKHLHAAGASLLAEDNNGDSLACFAVIAQNPALIHWLASLGQADLLLNTPGSDGNCMLSPRSPLTTTHGRRERAARESATR